MCLLGGMVMSSECQKTAKKGKGLKIFIVGFLLGTPCMYLSPFAK